MLKWEEVCGEMRLDGAFHTCCKGETVKQRLGGGVVISNRGGYPAAVAIGGQVPPCMEHFQPQAEPTTFRKHADLPDKSSVRLAGRAVANDGPHDFALGFSHQAGVGEVGRSAAPSEAPGVRKMIEVAVSVIFPSGFVMQCFYWRQANQVELCIDLAGA